MLYPYDIFIVTKAMLEMICGIIRYNFESRHPKNDSTQFWLKLAQRFQKTRCFEKFMMMDTKKQQKLTRPFDSVELIN